MVNDTIGDCIARIKNAVKANKDMVEMPSTKMLVKMAEIMKTEGFISDFEVTELQPQNVITIHFNRVNAENAIRSIMRVSKPGRRIYKPYTDIKRVRSGLGISIFSTPRGVITNKQAVKLKVGGEHICDIY